MFGNLNPPPNIPRIHRRNRNIHRPPFSSPKLPIIHIRQSHLRILCTLLPPVLRREQTRSANSTKHSRDMIARAERADVHCQVGDEDQFGGYVGPRAEEGACGETASVAVAVCCAEFTA